MDAAVPTPEQVREFVIAGHWDLPKVTVMLAEHPTLLHMPQQWGENDFETAIQAAAHAGSPHVAKFLLKQGAPLEICTAAMLGRRQAIESMLTENPDRITARGAHGIPLTAHAALSGDVSLMEMLHDRGAREGMSFALSNAVMKGHLEMVRWILAHGNPNLDWKNYQGKTPLEIATESGNAEVVQLLRGHEER